MKLADVQKGVLGFNCGLQTKEEIIKYLLKVFILNF